MKNLFTESDLVEIREATKQAETGHIGEIVPYIAGRIDAHDEARWKGATFGALLASIAAGVFFTLQGHWVGFELPWITLFTVVGASLGFILTRFPSIARILLTSEEVNRRVQVAAEAAFLREQVFDTERRTGILIFLAVFEHRAVILADEGIHENVPHEVWSGLVEKLTTGIGSGRPVEALIEVIAECGEILRNSGVGPDTNNVNELNDDVRIKDE